MTPRTKTGIVRWHLDEVFLKSTDASIPWACSRSDGDVLDILVQSRRDKKAATKFFRKLLNGLQYAPRVIVTDKLRSCSAARAEFAAGALQGNTEHGLFM